VLPCYDESKHFVLLVKLANLRAHSDTVATSLRAKLGSTQFSTYLSPVTQLLLLAPRRDPRGHLLTWPLLPSIPVRGHKAARDKGGADNCDNVTKGHTWKQHSALSCHRVPAPQPGSREEAREETRGPGLFSFITPVPSDVPPPHCRHSSERAQSEHPLEVELPLSQPTSWVDL
jgi:hypothetical protein